MTEQAVRRIFGNCEAGAFALKAPLDVYRARSCGKNRLVHSRTNAESLEAPKGANTMSAIKPGSMPPFPKEPKLAHGAGKRRKRWERINRQSPTRKIEDEIYRVKRRKFLKAHPRCEVRVRPDKSIAPRNSTYPLCGRRSTQVHHVRRRGRFYLDEKFWLATERYHHDWINNNGKEAERLGYVEHTHLEDKQHFERRHE